ncbi:hypothetical protein DOQ73_23095 [Salmonella enterica subsp. enterica]|nr:hypothetical protein [Salmonella enterica subsp. enterica serovar Javiana]
MKLIIFGATGMVGGGLLRVALESPNVESVLSVGRRSCGLQHPKLQELLLSDLFASSTVESQLLGYDACIWAVGVSSAGLNEAQYSFITEKLTLHWARNLLRLNPHLSFCYCSAGEAGGPGMWARVRRRVEIELQSMPFRHSGVVRPGFIRPAKGVNSQVLAYRVGTIILAPLFPVFVPLLPFLFTTSERLGRAMLRIVDGRADRFILESADINQLGQ